MKKKFTAIVLSLSMCLIPISQMQVLNAKTTTQEQKEEISLKFIKGRFGSSDKYEITPKDKLKEITKIFVENNEYEKKDYKAAVFGKAFYLDLSNNYLYLGQDPNDNEVIKIEFKDKSSISFKKVGSNFVKVEEKNNEIPSTPNDNPEKKENNEFSLKAINESFFENKYSIEPKDKISKIRQIFLNNKEYRKTSSKAAVFGENYFIDEANKVLYLGQKVPDGYVVKFILNDGSSISFERKGDTFVKKDNNYSKKYYLRIVGSFEAAIIGQQKYDALSSATGGGVNSNKNSNVRLQIAYTDKEIPSDSDFKDAKEVTHNLQLEAKMVSDDSGMQAKYSEMDNSIKLSGIPSKKGNYKVFVQSKDGKLKSNELDFEVFDSNEVTLEERLVDKEFKTLKNPATKKEWDMKPWVIKKFGKDKEEVTVPKNLKLWFGSRESGKYSELGYPIEENKATTQTLIVTGELYLINMKILSSVNIVVKDGGKLNLSDSSLYGKITVENGGTLEVNYDDYHKSFASGSSINGQIILKDGATLQNSVIYSNANYLTDGKNAKHIQTPVVSVQGNATIKGNVFIRGDEAPTGEQYKGQGAMEIAKGKTLTIEKDAKLGLFAGGRYALTSNGGDALKLEGTVAGKGTLIAVGGNGRFSGKGGNGVSGNGTITVDNAYLHGGNSYMSKNEGGKAVLDSITIDKKTKGYAIDGKKSTNSIEDSKLQNETPNWNGYTAPNKDLLDKLSTENAPSIVGEREKKELERILENTKKELENIKQELEKLEKEVKNPKKDLPRAIFLGLAVVMAVYVLINVAYLMTLPLDHVAGNQTVASEVAAKLFGGIGGKIITIGILISVYGAINGFSMAGIRVPYAMAKSEQIPFKNVWTKLNKGAVPVNAGLLLLVIAFLMMLTGSFDMLTDLLVFVMWFFYTATFLAVIILRKKEPKLERPYRVPLYPIVPIIAILGGVYTLVSTLISQTSLAMGGIALTLIGLLFYTELHKKFKK